MRPFDYVMLLVAAIISIMSAYYSIVGLTAIFAGAFWAIVVMAGSLELAKVTTAIWLHLNWARARAWIKLYMVPAVLVLMIISSMGIFGFLSKAHIEQDAAGQEAQARIDRIDDELARLEFNRDRAETRIQELEAGSTGADASIQNQIDREQARVDAAYARIQPALDTQNEIISDARDTIREQTVEAQAELDEVTGRLEQLQDLLDAGNVEAAQTLLINSGFLNGSADGRIGPQTRGAIASFNNELNSEREQLESQISSVTQLEQQRVNEAQAEITRLRQTAEEQVASSLELIQTLSAQLGTTTFDDLDEQIAAQNDIIRTANTEEDELIETKFQLQSEIRALEAEVGPIRYVAELIYGEADRSLLERAVQILILVIVGVFDPLAVVMMLAATSGIAEIAKRKIKAEREKAAAPPPDEDNVYINPNQSVPEPQPVQEMPVPIVTESVVTMDIAEELTITSPEAPVKDDHTEELVAETQKLIKELDDKDKLIQDLAERVVALEELDRTIEPEPETPYLFDFEPPEELPPVANDEIEIEESVELAVDDYEPVAPTQLEKVEELPIIEEPADDFEELFEVAEEEPQVVWTDEEYDAAWKENELLNYAGAGTHTREITREEITPRVSVTAEDDLELREPPHTSFGTILPQDPDKGDVFLKVDIEPNKLYKYSGTRWIEIERQRIDDTLAYNNEYIEWMIEQISRGVYDLDDVSEIVRDRIVELLEDNE